MYLSVCTPYTEYAAEQMFVNWHAPVERKLGRHACLAHAGVAGLYSIMPSLQVLLIDWPVASSTAFETR